jgi:predicted permease
MNDLRFALRMLIQNPGFTAIVVISLALGIGVNTLVFSLVNAVLLEPFPIQRPDRIVNVFTSRTGLPYGRSSYPDFEDLRDRATVFSGVLARCYWPVSVGEGSGKPEIVLGELVSGNYFGVLGVNPVLGRTFSAGEGKVEGADAVAVISHRFWKRRWAANPNIVGQTITLNARRFTVIGVGPEGFTGTMAGMPVDAWLPITMKAGIHPGDMALGSRAGGWLDIVARLKDEVPATEAQAVVHTIALHLAREHPDHNRDKQFTLVGGLSNRFPVQEMAQGVQAFMAILTAVVALVLLLTCSNVTNLMLSRAAAREQEMAMRRALGASRARVIRQLLTEGVVLALCGGALGLLFTGWGLQLLALLKPPSMIVPVGLEVPLNMRVLVYGGGVSVLVGLVIGLVPGWRSGRWPLYHVLRSGHPAAGAGGRHRTRFQRALVAVQLALSFVLLIAAGLCLKSLQGVLRMDPGFEFHRGITATLNLSYGNYDEAAGRAFFARVLEQVRQVPGVEAASLAVLPPLAYAKNQEKIEVPGYEPRAGESLLVENNYVSAGYFTTLGIPIQEGRPIDERDQREREGVMVINETMARKFWGAESPLDRIVTVSGRPMRIVGVAKDSKYYQLSEVSQPHFYVSLHQAHLPFASLLVRTAGDPAALLPAVLREVERLDPNLPISDARTLIQQMEVQYYPTRIVAISVGAFGLLALALATAGTYGVMAYSVRQRTRELGVRTALGANRRQILGLVLRQGLRTILVGAIAGLAGAVGTAQLLAANLYAVRSMEPVVFAGVAGLLIASALLACYLPARRAAQVDPLIALRCE